MNEMDPKFIKIVFFFFSIENFIISKIVFDCIDIP